MNVVVVLSAIAIRKGLSGTRVRDTFGVQEPVIFVGRWGVEPVLFGVAMDAVGQKDPSGSGTSGRRVQFEEGVLT